jgi:predicted GNAT family N-acyltransferase
MADAAIPIHWARGPEDVRGAFAVRERVFCIEQGVPLSVEIDERDDEALHLVAFERDGGRVIGTLRLLSFGGVAKVGRVAVDRDWRGLGVASRMLEIALSKAREQGYGEALLASQLDATGLYERAGFAVDSEPFDEVGITHVWMRRKLLGTSA